MTVATFQALFVAILALLPGALFAFAFERGRGAAQSSGADRLLRFVAGSAVFHAVFSGLEYWLYRRELTSGDFAAGDASLVLVQVTSLLYIAIPLIAGAYLGEASRTQGPSFWRRAITLITGGNVEPRAWDELWGRRPYGLVRVKLKEGPWVGGYYGPLDGVPIRSYAAGFPATGPDVDILFTQSVLVDPDTGDWLLNEEQGAILGLGPLLVRWEEVQMLEVQLEGVDAPIALAPPSNGDGGPHG